MTTDLPTPDPASGRHNPPLNYYGELVRRQWEAASWMSISRSATPARLLYRERNFIERLLPAVQAQTHVGELVAAVIQQRDDLPQRDLPWVDRRHDRVGAGGPPRRPRH